MREKCQRGVVTLKSEAVMARVPAREGEGEGDETDGDRAREWGEWDVPMRLSERLRSDEGHPVWCGVVSVWHVVMRDVVAGWIHNLPARPNAHGGDDDSRW